MALISIGFLGSGSLALSAAVLLLMVPESAGILIPSEATLLSAGAAAHAGLVPVWAAVLAATAGNLIGSAIAYWTARSRGAQVGRLLSSAPLRRSRELLATRGDSAVLIARLLPLARTFVSFPAGQVPVPFGRFLALTAAGCALWAALFVAIGDAAGAGAAAIGAGLGPVLLGIGAVVVAVALLSRA